jgi:hypothetical protein
MHGTTFLHVLLSCASTHVYRAAASCPQAQLHPQHANTAKCTRAHSPPGSRPIGIVLAHNCAAARTAAQRVHDTPLLLLPLLLLLQIQQAQSDTDRAAFGMPVVLLADKDKAEMDEVIKDLGPDQFGVHVLVRSGNPAVPEELARAAAGDARTVMMLQPDDLDDAEAASQQAAALAGIKAAGNVSKQKIVVQACSDSPLEFNAAHVSAAQEHAPHTGVCVRGCLAAHGGACSSST